MSKSSSIHKYFDYENSHGFVLYQTGVLCFDSSGIHETFKLKAFNTAFS